MIEAEPGLRLQLLGTFTMWREEQRLPGLRTRKEALLLTLLLLRHPQPVARVWLAGVLWPDSEDAPARFNLRRSLNNLRIVLGTDAFRLTAPVPHTLALDLSGVSVDLLAFDAAVRRNDPASLREAVDAYSGSLLEGCTEAWVIRERMQREQAFLCALEALAEEAIALQQWSEGASLLRRVLDLDPLRENAVQSLLRCQAGVGDILGALMTYRDFRMLLGQELRAEPNAQTLLLYQQIKDGQVIAHPSTASTLPASPEKPAQSLHLPHPLTALIGREAEVDAICMDLQSARLVTLTGAGGIGKTRLATAAATQCAPRFQDGVWFVDLTAVEDAALVARTVAQTLHVQEVSQRTTMETLAQGLQKRELLLVLDNCEHLIVSCAELAHSLLNSCPRLHILATSRQSLNLMGERVRRIPPLSLPPLPAAFPEAITLSLREQDKTGYAQIETSASVRLFVERARAGNAGFEMTPQNAPHVAQICHILEGVPFALELAAAWTKALEVNQIAVRLRDPLNLPQSDYVPGGSHRQTLRAMLAWSYSLLNAPEQALLQRLTVFVGGWSLEAAEEVCGGTVLEPLIRLLDKSLVVYDNRGGGKRYHLLETTRAYARELLPAAEQEAVADRYAHYFRRCAGILREYDFERRGMRVWQKWRTWNRAEHANCLAALQRMQERNAAEALAFRLDLSYIGVLSYHTPETRAWIAALYADPDPPQTPLYADLHCKLGQYALWIGENAIGRVLLERAIVLAEACGISRVIAYAACPLGIEEIRMERFEQAQQRLEQALDYSERADAPLHAAMCRDQLSRLAYQRGNREEAQRLVECNRRIGQERQDDHILAEAAWGQAWMASQNKNREGVLSFLKEFLTLIRRTEAPPLQTALYNAGRLACSVGEHNFAFPLLEEALQASQENGYRPGEGWALDAMASVALTQGDWRRAEEYARRSLQLFYELGERGSTSACLARLGEIHAQQGLGIYEVTLLAHIEATLQRDPHLHTPESIRSLHARATVWKEQMDPKTFDTAWRSGWNMSLEHAVAFALQPTAP